MACVVHLDLGLDVQLAHALGELVHLHGRVAELEVADGHGARIQGGHGGLRLDDLRAVFVGHAAAGGELHDARARFAHQIDGPPRHAEVGGEVVVLAQVDVDDGGAGLVGLPGALRDLLRGARHRRGLLAGGGGTGERGGDDRVHGRVSSWSRVNCSTWIRHEFGAMPVDVGVTNRLGVRMLMQPAVSAEWPGSPSGM